MKVLSLNKEYKISGAAIRLILIFYYLVMDGAESRYGFGSPPDS